MKKQNIILLALSVFFVFFSACSKPEEPVKKAAPQKTSEISKKQQTAPVPEKQITSEQVKQSTEKAMQEARQLADQKMRELQKTTKKTLEELKKITEEKTGQAMEATGEMLEKAQKAGAAALEELQKNTEPLPDSGADKKSMDQTALPRPGNNSTAGKNIKETIPIQTKIETTLEEKAGQEIKLPTY